VPRICERQAVGTTASAMGCVRQAICWKRSFCLLWLCLLIGLAAAVMCPPEAPRRRAGRVLWTFPLLSSEGDFFAPTGNLLSAAAKSLRACIMTYSGR
jgi:hypothetical protein